MQSVHRTMCTGRPHRHAPTQQGAQEGSSRSVGAGQLRGLQEAVFRLRAGRLGQVHEAELRPAVHLVAVHPCQRYRPVVGHKRLTGPMHLQQARVRSCAVRTAGSRSKAVELMQGPGGTGPDTVVASAPGNHLQGTEGTWGHQADEHMLPKPDRVQQQPHTCPGLRRPRM